MRIANLTPKTTHRPKLAGMAAMAALTLLVLGHARMSVAQESQLRTFSSAGEAAQALFQAVQSEDEQAVEAIVGAGKEVTSSSDEVEDKLERERFSQKYQEMHRLVQEPDGRTVLYIGAENWPFPIPLLSRNGAWYFDSETGTQEIVFWRLGENEATAIQVCEKFALTKKEQDAKATSDDPITQFAQSLIAVGTAYPTSNQSSSFHGYHFRIVRGCSASGTNSYGSGRKKTNGLTLIAYPEKYKSSGVMTFIVTQVGIVYEKDLGSNTATVASNLKERTPNSSWHATE